MDLNRTTLIQKVIAKGVILTPFEAIQLKYLSRKGILNELINTELSSDMYKTLEETSGPISPFMVNFICQRAREDSPDEYDKYNFAYEGILGQDDDSLKRGYMGLMLITQLRLIKAEFQNIFPEKFKKPLIDFDSYSYYHQDIKTFTQVLETLGVTFRLFIQDIDNILTLNYYIGSLVELEDLDCLKLLKMWLSKPKSNHDEDFEHLNGAYLCCDEKIISLVLNNNHQSHFHCIERRVGKLPMDFESESLKYVQRTIKDIVNSAKTQTTTERPFDLSV